MQRQQQQQVAAEYVSQRDAGAQAAALLTDEPDLAQQYSWAQQQQEEGSDARQHPQHQHQLGHGYLLVLRAMAAAVRQAWQAWGVLLARLGASSLEFSRGYGAVSDSSDAAVGSTPPWLQDEPGVGVDVHGVLPAFEAGESDDGAGGYYHDPCSSSSSSSSGRALQQAFTQANLACSKQLPWLFGRDRPMMSVDWLRQGVVPAGVREQSNCSNSFAFVTAALAESTMALLGYTGSVKRISEAQLMACMPDSSCSRGATVHVLLNSLACNGFAAAASGPNAFPVKESWKAVEKPSICDAGDFNPVEAGITGWSFVPPEERAFAQALSRTPIKVSVDATMLQSYRAGFIGCNVRSRIANHALLAVGYSQRVRATEVPGLNGGGQRNFTFYTGGSYWMLRNSWGLQGSVDGYVYVAKGCGAGNTAPLGLLANRGVMPFFNASQTYGVGRLQCYFPGDTPDPGCKADLLLKLSSFCAKVPDYMPLKVKTNCSCSCIPA